MSKDRVAEYLAKQDWRIQENANAGYSYPSLMNYVAGAGIAEHILKSELPERISKHHQSGDFHIHDLSNGIIGYCAGWEFRRLLLMGWCGPGHKERPARHFDSALNQLATFLLTMQGEWAGAQAVNSFDTLLAPFIRKDELDYKQVKQCIQNFVCLINAPVRLGQCAFTNISLDWLCPEDLADTPVIIGGEQDDELTYADFQPEMDMINRAFLEVMRDGDAEGRTYTFPLPTYNITRGFDYHSENARLLFEVTGKYGIPNFQNFVNSDLKPSDVRAMCPLTASTKVLVRNETGEVTPLKIGDIYHSAKRGTSYSVWTPQGWKAATPVHVTDTQKVYRIHLSNGIYVDMGANHLQPVRDRGTLKAEELAVGMQLPFNAQAIPSELGGYDLGYRPDLPMRENCGIHCQSDSQYTYYSITEIEDVGVSQSLYCMELDTEDHLFMLANGLMTHNCRLQLDISDMPKVGGLFGAGSQTGSIGVVTLNMPRLGYLSKDKQDFMNRLDSLLTDAVEYLEIKRRVVQRSFDTGLVPHSVIYLDSLDNHYSTIGVIGMHEMCRNLLGVGIDSEEGKAFSMEVIQWLANKCTAFRRITGHRYNVEGVPGEGCSHRLAKLDKSKYPDIITAGEGAVYYTNSSYLPVGYTDCIFEAMQHQDALQQCYTGGVVFHAFIGEQIEDPDVVGALLKKLCEQSTLRYITLTPTYSVCPEHGYIAGEHTRCPHCS